MQLPGDRINHSLLGKKAATESILNLISNIQTAN